MGEKREWYYCVSFASDHLDSNPHTPTYLCKLITFSMKMMIMVTKMVVSIYRVWRPSNEVIHYGFSACLTHTVSMNVSCYCYWNKRVETTTKRVRRQEKRKVAAGPVYMLSSAPGRG